MARSAAGGRSQAARQHMTRQQREPLVLAEARELSVQGQLTVVQECSVPVW